MPAFCYHRGMARKSSKQLEREIAEVLGEKHKQVKFHDPREITYGRFMVYATPADLEQETETLSGARRVAARLRRQGFKPIIKRHASKGDLSWNVPVEDAFRTALGRAGRSKRAGKSSKSHAAVKASSASKTFHAVEFDLAKGERTGLVMEFVAEDMQEAAQHLVYTLNLKSKGWKVSPSGKTVQKMTGDIGWHLVRAGTPAASRMGLD